MTPTGEPRTDVELVREVVTVGVSSALAVWLSAGADQVQTKSGVTDVVTAADLAAEAAMVELLRRHRPRDAILGEEGTSVAGDSGRTWVLDPLDGTYNFTRAGERWCSAAALRVGDDSVLGAVAGGGAARVWVGGRDLPGTEDDVVLPRLRDPALDHALLLTYLHPPHHHTGVGEAWRRLVAAVGTVRMTGSGSLDATDVAAGRAELSVQHSVPVWDSAPGEALVRSVGGESARVRAAGVEWFLLGTSGAVTHAARLLADG